jgi:hypothetical protein
MYYLTKDNENALKPVVGRNLTDSELYLGHFLGQQGATNFFKALKTNKDLPVDQFISPKVLESNRSVFYDKTGKIKTANQIYSWANNKMKGSSKQFEDDEVVLFQDPIVQAPETSEVSYLADPSLFSNFTKEKEAKSAQEELVQAQQQKQNENEFIQNLISQAQVKFVDPEKDNSFQDGGVIEDNLGQWKYPGQVTKINSPNITMHKVPFKVLGVADTGETKMMMPNKDYVFKGAKSVTEYPQLTGSEKAFLEEFQQFKMQGGGEFKVIKNVYVPEGQLDPNTGAISTSFTTPSSQVLNVEDSI